MQRSEQARLNEWRRVYRTFSRHTDSGGGSAARWRVGRIAKILRSAQLATLALPLAFGMAFIKASVYGLQRQFHISEVGAELHYRPEIHHCDAVRDMTHDREVMRNEEHPDIFDVRKTRSVFAAEPGRTRQAKRTARQDHDRRRHSRARADPQPLPLAATELVWYLVGCTLRKA